MCHPNPLPLQRPWPHTPTSPRTVAAAVAGTPTATRPMHLVSASDDSSRVPSASGIAFEDWDLLFRAALELLASVAVEKATVDDGLMRLQGPGKVLKECLYALDQLRRSAPTAPFHEVAVQRSEQ